jgi:PAS domain-containing protein
MSYAMTKHIKSTPVVAFRQCAEEISKKKPSKSVSRTDNAQTRKLILDLKVHQKDLELQNQELQRAKNRLTTQAEKYAELYDFAPTGYFTLALSGDILELNLLGSQMLGKEREFLRDKNFGLYVSIDSIPIFNSFLNRVFSNKSIQTCEIVLVTNGNLSMNVSLSGTVAVNNVQYLISVTDLTHHKMAEASLIQMATGWQTTFDASNDMIWLLDKDQRVVRSNKVSEKFCHRPSSELIGKHCWELLHGMSEAIPECPFRRTTGSLHRETLEL